MNQGRLIASEYLTDEQLDSLDETLLKYGNDDSILGVSELDGFLTALVSGPDMIPPSRWFPELWGGAGKEPEWETENEVQQFMKLVMQHMNNIVTTLMNDSENFEALFLTNPKSKTTVLIAEEWCFGYMRGVDLGDWPSLPNEINNYLAAIALHGREENFDKLKTFSLQEHQQTVANIEPAARKLHAYWLAQRTPFDLLAQKPARPIVKTGRNEPCPCGSGKKFKQCCLH